MCTIANSTLSIIQEVATNSIEKRSTTLGHNEYEIVAQSACTSMAIDRKLAGWTFAVQRVCSSRTETCVRICSSKFLHTLDQQTSHSTWSCIGALHVYKGRPSSAPGNFYSPSIGLKVYWNRSYHTGGGCGPNYCCCHAH